MANGFVSISYYVFDSWKVPVSFILSYGYHNSAFNLVMEWNVTGSQCFYAMALYQVLEHSTVLILKNCTQSQTLVNQPIKVIQSASEKLTSIH